MIDRRNSDREARSYLVDLPQDAARGMRRHVARFALVWAFAVTLGFVLVRIGTSKTFERMRAWFGW